MSKITESAKGRDCTVRIWKVCNYRPETTVFAHDPFGISGLAEKYPDSEGCYACSDCHDVLDGRAPLPDGYSHLNLVEDFHRAGRETRLILIEEGLITLK